MRTRLPAALLVGALFCPVIAHATAGVPDATNSTIPSHIVLVGRAGATPSITGQFTIIVRDSDNNPVNSPLVEVDFSGCGGVAPGVQYYPGLSVNCSTQRVQGTAGPNGQIDMIITGFGKQGPDTPSCTTILANGVPIGQVSVAAYDLDGMNGVDLGDLAIWLNDFGGGLNPERSDIDGSNGVGVSDLSLWACEYTSLRATQSANNCAGTLIVSPVVVSGAMNLAWDDCYPGSSTNNKAFACNTNAGTAGKAVVSVIPSVNIPYAQSFTADIDIQTVNPATTSIPSWWQLVGQSTGSPSGCGGVGSACRNLALTVTGGSGPGGCTDLWTSSGSTMQQMFYNVSGPDRATLRVLGVIGDGLGGSASMNAAEEYAVVTVNISRQKTTGTGSCPGCAEPMCLSLRSVDIHQDVTVNPTLPVYRTNAAAQQTAIGWQTTILQASQCDFITPVQNQTWGRVKQLYR